jgi:hypothetical protein
VSRHLHVINAETGEVVEDERDLLIEQLTRDLHGKQVQIAKLRKEVSELRLVEPEAQTIIEVLEYCRDRFNKPRQHITPGGERWEKCRARLRDKPTDRPAITPDELKRAADGALLDPWLNGSAPKAPKDGRYLDAKTIFKSPEQVQRLCDLALGFKAETGIYLGDFLDYASESRIVHWGFLMEVCICGHRRNEHSLADPLRHGEQPCLVQCRCSDFDFDIGAPFNVKRLEKVA